VREYQGGDQGDRATTTGDAASRWLKYGRRVRLSATAALKSLSPMILEVLRT